MDGMRIHNFDLVKPLLIRLDDGNHQSLESMHFIGGRHMERQGFPCRCMYGIVTLVYDFSWIFDCAPPRA